MSDSESSLIYSTSSGSVCSGCSKPKKNCICRELKNSLVPEAGRVQVRFEISGRKGKGVTLITGLTLSQDSLLALSKKLKSQFGTGGSVKEYTIELQGDLRDKAVRSLRALGHLK